MDAFRKIDIDQYEEDVLLEEELYEADPRDPATILADTKQKGGAVRGSLSKGDVASALGLVLENPPYGPNVDEAKVRISLPFVKSYSNIAQNLNLQTLVSILNSTKSTEIPAIVRALSPDAQDNLMKYLYKGMALPGWGDVSGSILLTWHEKQLVQHGIANYQLTHSLRELRPTDSSLLGIPSESLTHITSFLSPPSLLSLSRTNKQLHDHIDDDNTWRRAYFCQFLGISPEDDLLSRGGDGGESRMHMVRRTETTWKREFVSRRYERSRSAAVAHHPVDSAVADTMHLMPSNLAAPTVPPGLLVTSLQYGVVSRSYPVTGKILRGYFDAAGTLNGMGVGNPNAEFSPDVSKCAITADGGTAKILWGLRNGAVAVTVAAKALDSARVIGGKWTKCIAEQQHVGSVQDAIWAGGSSYYCVTGGADGRVKLWDGKKVTCLWTSERHDFRDPCVRVGINLAHSVIASVMHSGQIFVWTGFEQVFASENPAEDQELSIHEYKMSAPPRAVALPTQGEDAPAREVTALHLHCPSSGIISVITVYRNDTHFYRATVDVRTKSIARASYGDGNTGAIGALEPVFGPADTSFVVVGDQLGCVTVYSWSDVCPDTPAPPIHKFEAHGNGAVSALKWTPTVLVTGSSLGSAEVWDSLDFTHLRSFPSVGFRASERLWDAVSRIIVDKDLVVLSVGTKVSAWLGGPVAGSERKGKHLRMPAKAKSSVAKWQRQVELHKDIADSRRELEDEKTYTRRAYGHSWIIFSLLTEEGQSPFVSTRHAVLVERKGAGVPTFPARADGSRAEHQPDQQGELTVWIVEQRIGKRYGTVPIDGIHPDLRHAYTSLRLWQPRVRTQRMGQFSAYVQIGRTVATFCIDQCFLKLPSCCGRRSLFA
ncbi:hypothetical protein EUX98_g5461 [Antrodiella citrinella]|uniref:Actin-related protein 2/3 complex subunit 5 n=1 Tax=Antrodiella citrinella TaxID=2447956 RepID=A0A4V3XIC6_9APHY|nr:hypothetical protein EUX98_g5461 [Antrodiella citrinella]